MDRRPPAPARNSPFGAPEKSGSLTLDSDFLLTWVTKNVTEVEIVVLVKRSLPQSFVMGPFGALPMPRLGFFDAATYQLYDHSSGFRGVLLDARQWPIGPVGGVLGNPGGTFIWDTDGTYNWLVHDVEEAQLWWQYEDQADEMIDHEDAAGRLILQGVVLLPQYMFVVRVQFRALGRVGADWHTLYSFHLPPLGGGPRSSYEYFAIKPPPGSYLTPFGTGWVFPRRPPPEPIT